ncbi:hypothetical protein [Mycobacteroides abscessus]|uniref:hypothetical protein n=1 Tax=Mycobacteroides abscessus TaxID=36809 RepID=UPI00092597AF|nr:hypothetical protein [Mycobacteroides abscessus]SHX64649.1 Uncharacterised protein [Mycobacteroides abscessus subsp. abscessus]SHZ18321.1 Uncharacterised protein [Mycobacteroides abscessus subsp. abscessus]SIB50878.1 Uncharacterised protein [Mycobacteroides abscessus subsp. abscessus]SIF18806.1 Uncharacterised protein [Mycobacteroides abscessus subsp. abscessus]SKI48343.1 Uncharacterised protein [Mycobacteroides abscessus subsp. abscessus]
MTATLTRRSRLSAAMSARRSRLSEERRAVDKATALAQREADLALRPAVAKAAHPVPEPAPTAPRITANCSGDHISLRVEEVEVEPWDGDVVSGPTTISLTIDEATALLADLTAALSK